MVIKTIDDEGNIYYKIFDEYIKYLEELEKLSNSETLYETKTYNSR